MKSKSISCSSLDVAFKKGRCLLKNVTLEIKQNKVVLLYGPSGSGKTTLFNILCGLCPPHSEKGKVFWRSQKVTDLGKANKERCKFISMIYSHYYFIQSLSVEDNIILPAVFAGMEKNKIKKRLELLYELFVFDDAGLNLKDLVYHRKNAKPYKKNPVTNSAVNLSDERKTLAGTAKAFMQWQGRNKQVKRFMDEELSNGQKELVGIARAFMLDSPFIFVDELLRSVDERAKKAVWEKIMSPELGIGKERGFFMITHDERLKKEPQIDVIYEIKKPEGEVSDGQPEYEIKENKIKKD